MQEWNGWGLELSFSVASTMKRREFNRHEADALTIHVFSLTVLYGGPHVILCPTKTVSYWLLNLHLCWKCLWRHQYIDSKLTVHVFMNAWNHKLVGLTDESSSTSIQPSRHLPNSFWNLFLNGVLCDGHHAKAITKLMPHRSLYFLFLFLLWIGQQAVNFSSAVQSYGFPSLRIKP